MQAAIALRPEITTRREEIERGRRLPADLVTKMKQAGIFRMAMPRDWGGPELDPLTQMRIFEALAIADTSVAWCACINVDGGYLTGFLDQNVAREMYRDIDAPTAAVGTPGGRAERVNSGFKVSGRWAFASGCHNAKWFVGVCIEAENGEPLQTSDGMPMTRWCFLPMSECEIADNWHTTGMCGTGSNDVIATDRIVPEERTFALRALRHYRSGGLYRAPLNVVLKASGPPLGAARAAIDFMINEASHKDARPMVMGGKLVPTRKLRDEAFVQDAIGRAEAKLGAARAYAFEVIGDIWRGYQHHERLSERQIANFMLVHPEVFGACVAVVELMYKARGGSAIYAGCPLDRLLRDVLTLNQHLVNSARSYGSAGRLMLGLAPEVMLS
jgi:alkylation response protein AidB-like acyl-CoA dehydrogenase